MFFAFVVKSTYLMSDGMRIVLTILTLFYVISSLLPAWNAAYWWVRGFDFPRVQMLFFGLICLLLLVAFGNGGWWYWILTAFLLLGLGFDLYRVFPYTSFASEESKTAPKNIAQNDQGIKHANVSIISANVLMSNRDADKLLKLIAEFDSDVVALLEPDTWWEERLRSIEKAYPHFVKIPLDNTYGMLLYSKFPLRDVSIKYLTQPKVPAIFCQLILPGNPNVKLFVLHPKPPRPQEGSSANRDAELIQVAQLVKEAAEPTLVIGDLNDVAWSHTTRLFQRISGLLDPRRGRGFYNTFPVDYPYFRYPLDHVFHSGDFYFEELSVLPDIGSDHFPILARFTLTDPAEREQSPVEAEEGDAKEAEALEARPKK